MKEVSMNEFYDFIGPLDVVVSVIGSEFPYTSEFKTRQGEIKGRVVESITEKQRYPITKKFYIYESI